MNNEIKYRMKEVTPEPLRCLLAACPAVYEVVDISGTLNNLGERSELPIKVNIPHGTHYLIIGEKMDPAEAGLEGKVGQGESLIRVPTALINNLRIQK